MVHIKLATALGRLGDRLRSLTLGAHKQHAAASSHGVAHELQRAIQMRHGLRQVDDMNFVAGTVNIRAHFRVPAMCLVAKMYASFQKLTHGERRQRHGISFPVVPPREEFGWRNCPEPNTGRPMEFATGIIPACEVGAV